MSRLDVSRLRFLDRGPIELTIGAGECVSLAGASGSGKTLLLRAIADLDPHEGIVRLDGTACDATPAPSWRRAVGMLPAESAWWADTVGPHFAERVDVEPFGFEPDVFAWEVRRLSTGERQRIALARLLANRPKALLLDEPTASLDAGNVDRLETVVADYRRAQVAPVLWVSHDDAQAARVASRHFELVEGRLVGVRWA